MQLRSSIKEEHRTRSRLAPLRVGDQVNLYDGVKDKNIWQQVAELKEADGRLKIRVNGTSFFFDESLVMGFDQTKKGARE